jgi:hypothetical protein
VAANAEPANPPRKRKRFIVSEAFAGSRKGDDRGRSQIGSDKIVSPLAAEASEKKMQACLFVFAAFSLEADRVPGYAKKRIADSEFSHNCLD